MNHSPKSMSFVVGGEFHSRFRPPSLLRERTDKIKHRCFRFVTRETPIWNYYVGLYINTNFVTGLNHKLRLCRVLLDSLHNHLIQNQWLRWELCITVSIRVVLLSWFKPEISSHNIQILLCLGGKWLRSLILADILLKF